MADIFSPRKKLAEIIVANEVFNHIINKPDFADLSGLKLLMKDGGFYFAAVRPVKAITNPTTMDEEVLTGLKNKMLDCRTVFLNNDVLCAANDRDLKEELSKASSNEDYINLKLYDTLLYKKLYETNMILDINKNIDPSMSLDDVSRILEKELTPAFAFSFFTSETMGLMSSLLDLETNDGVIETVKMFKEHEYLSKYTGFLALMEKTAFI